MLVSCQEKKQEKELTPWGTVVGEDGEEQTDSSSTVSLGDIVAQGEMIMLTLNGPQTYYDYHGHGMGLHYLLCEKLAQKIGVKLRVEVCKDTTELVKKLADGEGDIIACPIGKHQGITEVGPHWAVNSERTDLKKEIDSWYKPNLLTETEKMQKTLLASGGVIRHVYAPILNRQKGIISRFDAYFQRYAPTARLDWRLLAAQCYQESTFDPRAHSWAGACGLMQIMPSTADHLGLPRSEMYNPEKNIAAAARYMNELMSEFRDASTQYDRICFALASYNGGKNHIRDAQALARKHGKNAGSWNDVKGFIAKMSLAEYYTDPVVKYGYMRGSETYNYVEKIVKRWVDYGGRPARSLPSFGGYDGPSTQPSISGTMTPHRAKKSHNKYKI